jgi:hypothetical protein
MSHLILYEYPQLATTIREPHNPQWATLSPMSHYHTTPMSQHIPNDPPQPPEPLHLPCEPPYPQWVTIVQPQMSRNILLSQYVSTVSHIPNEPLSYRPNERLSYSPNEPPHPLWATSYSSMSHTIRSHIFPCEPPYLQWATTVQPQMGRNISNFATDNRCNLIPVPVTV